MEGLTSAFTKSASPPTSPRPPCFSLAASVLRAAVNSANVSLYNASTSSSSLPFVSLTLRSSFVSCFPLFLPIYLVSHCFPKTPKPEPSKARTLFHSVSKCRSAIRDWGIPTHCGTDVQAFRFRLQKASLPIKSIRVFAYDSQHTLTSGCGLGKDESRRL